MSAAIRTLRSRSRSPSTKNGRPHTVLMSAAVFEVLVKGRVARAVEDLDDDTLKAIANSSVPAEYAAPG